MVLLAATVLPLLIYASVSTAISYRIDREAQQAATLARAKQISDAVDARLAVISATMRALATIRSIPEANWVEARQRAAEIASLDPTWRDVALIDLREGTTLVDLQGGDRRDLSAVASRFLPTAATSTRPHYTGVVRVSDGGPAILASMPVRSGRYALLVTLDPTAIQRLLISSAPHAGVSAVVDRGGRFIARTRAWPKRLGSPATRFVRDAIAHGQQGIYRGVTYEGLENYSGFYTSPVTGWSTHVAVSSELIDGPQNGWRVASMLAAVFGLSLALALVLLILRLVAVRRSADERVRQTERIEAIGKLTGGIAHDFNNMLAIVLGSLELAQRRLNHGDSDVRGFIDNAVDGAKRAADLTRRLLIFSRRQPLAPSIVEVNALVRSTAELLRRTLPENIVIDLALQPDLWPILVDPGQLENAIVNLAVNARDAMPDGGRLTIRTENRPDASNGSRGMVALTLRDTGVGMPASVAARAFEPFFTTKDVGKGTGLGLSQIHGFAVQSGGDAQIDSVPGQGTSVTLVLPRTNADDATAPTDGRVEAYAPEAPASETILVVEDDPRVRRMSVEALEDLGYLVRQAADANAALALLDAEPDVRLMLTDIVMPGMSGRDLAALVARKYPHIGIILVTGYEPDQPIEEDPAVLHKPFGVSQLAHRIRQELAKAA